LSVDAVHVSAIWLVDVAVAASGFGTVGEVVSGGAGVVALATGE
jgi:hypothetical protein